MSLESLENFFGSDKTKRSLQRTQQAFQIAARIRDLTSFQVNVIIRGSGVVVQASNAAVATKLRIIEQEIKAICSSVVGFEPKVIFRVQKRGD